MAKVAIVCLYGVGDWDVDCDWNMLRYLAQVADTVQKLQIERIILCGGKTNPDRSISEAEWVKDFFTKERLERMGQPEIVLEPTSLNTRENIAKARKHLSAVDEVFIFCEWTRRTRVYQTATEVLMYFSKLQVIPCNFDLSEK